LGRKEAEAKLILLAKVTNIFNLSIEWQRLPDGDDKQKVLDSLSEAGESADLSDSLAVINLSPSRLRNGTKRAVACDLEDHLKLPQTLSDQDYRGGIGGHEIIRHWKSVRSFPD
jgi:hypothetical protein